MRKYKLIVLPILIVTFLVACNKKNELREVSLGDKNKISFTDFYLGKYSEKDEKTIPIKVSREDEEKILDLLSKLKKTNSFGLESAVDNDTLILSLKNKDKEVLEIRMIENKPYREDNKFYYSVYLGENKVETYTSPGEENIKLQIEKIVNKK
ncbi:MAG: hypothetical protein ACTHWZ_03780 [Peptoniphilaceae bacterium]